MNGIPIGPIGNKNTAGTPLVSKPAKSCTDILRATLGVSTRRLANGSATRSRWGNAGVGNQAQTADPKADSNSCPFGEFPKYPRLGLFNQVALQPGGNQAQPEANRPKPGANQQPGVAYSPGMQDRARDLVALHRDPPWQAVKPDPNYVDIAGIAHGIKTFNGNQKELLQAVLQQLPPDHQAKLMWAMSQPDRYGPEGQPGLGERIWLDIKKEFNETFEKPLGPSQEFLEHIDQMPSYLAPVKFVDEVFYRVGVPAADAALRTAGALYDSAVDVFTETMGAACGSVDFGSGSGCGASAANRDLKALPQAMPELPARTVGGGVVRGAELLDDLSRTRSLTAADLGLKEGMLDTLSGSFHISRDGVATVYVGMIRAQEKGSLNPFRIIEAMKARAKEAGANILRVEGDIIPDNLKTAPRRWGTVRQEFGVSVVPSLKYYTRTITIKLD